MSASSEDTLMRAVLRGLWRAGELDAGPGAALPRFVSMHELLRDAGGQLAGLRRALTLLEQRGCVLERTPAGVRLVATGLACWRDVLEDVAQQNTGRLGHRALVYATTTSTNDVAWQCASAADADGLVVLADEQTAGRGRLGHRWLARRGQSVLLSLVLTGMSTESIDRLTLLAGLATAEALEGILAAGGRQERLEIKWPNDVLLEGRKLAGILVERRKLPGDPVVIGIGINVAQGPKDFPASIARRAISVGMAGVSCDRLRIAAAVLQSLAHYRSRIAHEAHWLERWKSRCVMLGRPVTLRSGGHLVRGRVADVAPLQGLVVRDDTGATRFFSARTSTVV
jgi:BirA family transcriptional regulator, biotin operon repressor / biotin---[acetyl-CoA-carboxylase] ligase